MSGPRAMAPTKTQMECVSGSVGRNWDRRTVGASPERVSLIVFVGRWSVMGFLITRRSFSEPWTPRMLSL